jgi:PhoPQ-activated pathogenicity-related protein
VTEAGGRGIWPGKDPAEGGVRQDRQPGGAIIVSEHRGWRASVGPAVGILAAGILVLAMHDPARAGLEDYVRKPDPAFAWVPISNHDTPLGKIYSLKLTSQVWQGITWTHDLQIYEPREVTHRDTMVLFIAGGVNGQAWKDEDHKDGFTLAKVCGARAAVLRQVPNQPLLDGKSEDELIAETFVRFLQTQDEDWPLLFPMVKSAVKAMDAVQAWAKEHGKPAVTRFVVAGRSKRGWTTWLTGAMDDRVVAIAPMVIVMLNLGKQGPNQLKVWGQYSEQVHDYVERGLMEKVATPIGTRLWTIVDPFTYSERLAKPKLLINGTNDRYWTLDALDLYWGGLKGPKYLVELPNAGHTLDKNQDWALNGVGAFFRQVVTDRPLPRLSWEFISKTRDEATLTIHTEPAPRSARLWTARSETRDFREADWESTPISPGTTITGTVRTSRNGHLALFGELEYQVDGIPYHLTTTFFEPGIAPPDGAEAPR